MNKNIFKSTTNCSGIVLNTTSTAQVTDSYILAILVLKRTWEQSGQVSSVEGDEVAINTSAARRTEI